jgi:hypothetical protein
MIRRLRRLLGWDTDTASTPSRPVYIIPPTTTPPSSAAPARRAGTATKGGKRPRPGAGRTGSHAAKSRPDKGKSAKDLLAERLAEDLTLDDDPLDLLHNPELSLDTSAKAGFDPYNTGAFDRSSSWDRVNKNRKR